MSPFFYTLYGALVGALLGVGGPVLAAFLFAWSDDFEPGGNGSAATAFALISIFTCPLGALLGGRLGFLRAKTGSWFSSGKGAGWSVVPDLEGASRTNAAARSLSQDRIDEFLFEERDSSLEISVESKEEFLVEAMEDYRTLLRMNVKSLVIIAVLGVVFFPAWFFFIYQASYVGRQIFMMRDRLWSTAEMWDIQLNSNDFDIPNTLRK